jgi:isoleucyl-tRNA synthetase
METFVDNLSNWYVRRSRRRFWKSGNDADKIGAYNTLYSCLVTFVKLLAPFMPFMAEEIYQNLVKSVFPNAPDSVHLTDFPAADETKINIQLSAATRMAVKVASLGRAARAGANVKVRQPLSKIVVVVKSKSERESLNSLKSQIIEELNVKDIECIESYDDLNKLGYACMTEGDLSVGLCTEVSAELEREGMAREIVHRIQGLRKTAGFEIADYILTYWEGDDYLDNVMRDSVSADYIKNEVLARELTAGVPAEGVFSESFKLSGHEMKLGVKKL